MANIGWILAIIVKLICLVRQLSKVFTHLCRETVNLENNIEKSELYFPPTFLEIMVWHACWRKSSIFFYMKYEHIYFKELCMGIEVLPNNLDWWMVYDSKIQAIFLASLHVHYICHWNLISLWCRGSGIFCAKINTFVTPFWIENTV